MFKITFQLVQRCHFLLGMLVFGTATAITMKMQLETYCTGFKGVKHPFDKPFFQSIAMFASMSLALPVHGISQPFIKKREERLASERQALLPKAQGSPPDEKKKNTNPLIVVIPCVFDLVASTMMTFGLIYISVSVFQMLRGSMVVFSAFMRWIFLKKPINNYQGIGIAIAVCALVMVGVAGCLEVQPNMHVTVGQTIFGCCLVVGSQFIQAGQLVTEEFLLKNLDLAPLKIVGFEGLWGLILMVGVACPLAFVIPGDDLSPMPHNSLENTWDSLLCLGSNYILIIIVLVFCGAVLAYNCYGMLITDAFNAVNRTIFEAVRTACIWVTDLIIHLIWKTSVYGEIWSAFSWLELGGFLVLVLSTFIYNGILKIPGIRYPQSEPRSSLPPPPAGDIDNDGQIQIGE